MKNGFTLIEIVVTVAILAILCLGIYGLFTAMYNAITYYRERITVSALADQYLEIARNLPYTNIGTQNGNPHGNLPDLPNPATVTFNGINYQIYYAVSFVDDPADGAFLLGTDLHPKDYKQIKLYVKNTRTNSLNYFLTNIVPQGLEDMSSGGALNIKVFNAVGQPVSGASIHIVNISLNPAIDVTRTSDASGNWVEVGLPNSANNYRITATKTNYSTDRTYPSSQQNPNPVKPDATILSGQVTAVSFSIDKLSNLTFRTLDQTCQAISNVGLQVRGSKLIGAAPDVYKFSNTYTSNSSGQISLSNIEWDNYTPTLTGTNYMIYGSSPDQQIVIFPDTSQNFNLILGPKTDNSLLITVKDSATGSPIEGANVDLQNASLSVDTNKITGGSVWSQQDWTGADGEGVSYTEVPAGLRLAKSGDNYVSSGFLISSTFDTGTDSTSYTTLTWQPTSQDPLTFIKFQIATNNDNLTWNYLGPDGTGNTFYETPGDTISAENNNSRYVRYKIFLSTQDSSKTPVLTSLNINYVSGCFTPGQAMFAGLQSDSDYQITVSAGGYQAQTISNININGYNNLQILLAH